MQPTMTSNPMGANPKLAAMFGMQSPARQTAPQGGLPTITQPVRPNIPMPTTPAPKPMQGSGQAPAPLTPWSMISIGGHQKPAWMTSAVQQTGRPTGQLSEADAKNRAAWMKQSYRAR